MLAAYGGNLDDRSHPFVSGGHIFRADAGNGTGIAFLTDGTSVIGISVGEMRRHPLHQRVRLTSRPAAAAVAAGRLRRGADALLTGSFGPSCKRSLGSRHVSDFLRSYLTIGVFGGVAVALVAVVMGLGSLVRPTRRSPRSTSPTSPASTRPGRCGARRQIRYYIFALLFVLFDVEAVFIFPWATRAEAYGWFGLVEMGVFIVILALGLLYAWRKRVLRWI